MIIPRIVLTGGPCGGKSTAVKHIQQELPKVGITPVIVPELATMMFHSGIRWSDIARDEKRGFQFQINMIKTQIANEDSFYSFAHLIPGQKVIVCDRGTIDNMVYAKDEWHEDILSQVGSLGYLKRRYDGIIHLKSLAWGEGYSKDNPARIENQEEAKELDTRTLDMWRKGPSYGPHPVIEHTVDLDKKMNKVVEFIKYIMSKVNY